MHSSWIRQNRGRAALVLLAAAITAACGTTHQAAGKRLPETRLERGRYLVEGVAHCFMCHSEVDWNRDGAQPLAHGKGAGAVFPEADIPFLLVAPNITPDHETGVGSWTAEQLAKAIREGIRPDGRRLFPMMPYLNFREMTDEDLESVITYLATIPPVRNRLPVTQLPEPVRQSLPPHLPVSGPVKADLSSPVKRGEYLVKLGNCEACHTPRDGQGQPLEGMRFGGGMVLAGPWGEVASANLTPDPSGIPYYDEALFVQVLRTGSVQARKLNSIMPWGYFRLMTDDDLKAIWAYLRTLRPVAHRVDNTEPVTDCPRCGARHGLGSHHAN